ncbi:MAG TPA: hypothetical protein VGK58_03095 [Lacipirellulaceae bacterium]
MRFHTPTECEEWLMGRERIRPDIANAKPALRLEYPSSSHRMYSWAHWIASSITCEDRCLLWITEWGIWSSSENWHLYYRLRQSYHDMRLIDETPGHLFLAHETADLASFLQIAMLNGWGGYVLPAANYVNAFFSHDEYFDFYSDDPSLIDQVRNALIDSKSVAH